ncbi:MAG: GAK system XXXCH domain-containing protein, partial [Humidesulfovibrio sp.]|nr:GAK system XXXCH domain-containing protein [Humidesulfovibrio sp.]
TEAELAETGLPGLLRELASALESGLADGLLAGLPVQDYRKLVLVAERGPDGLRVELKAKRAGEVRVPTADRAASKIHSSPSHKDKDKAQAGRDKYRQLKQGLQADYKAVQASAREGRLPEAELLESFLFRAELMAQGEQPVSGAALAEMTPANAAFLDDCQALRQACAAQSPAALAAVLERLARRKAACHAQFRQEERH